MVSFSDAPGNVFDGGILSIASLRLGLTLWFSYLVCLGIYRIYFSPIAKFPGPKIAALTTWYQGYYDIWLRGQYIFRVEKMHEKYGPIVRINPHELHISDPEYIDDLYSGPSKKRDKFKFTGRSITLPESTVATMPHELHRKRRAAMNPYFSKTSVRRLEPIILESLAKLLARLDACFKSGEIMPMTVAYKATTSDIITHYSFGESTDYLDKEDYNVTFFEAVESLFELAHWMTHIAWIGPLMAAIPIPVAAKFLPGMDSLVKMQKQWKSQIEKIRDSKDEEFGKNTVFHGVLRSNLPESEKSSSRLQQEAQLLVLAGQDTTATTLSAITYHLLANPDKLKKLRSELEVAMPDPNSPPTCAQVEQLPYLTAVIQEGIRLHPGAIMRMQRVSPDEPLYYGKDNNTKWTIPAGTPVSMDAFSTQTNPAIFPEPREFRPERWIGNHRLDRYLLSFSKGTRGCLGINLAYQELYLVLAGVFRKYDVDDGTTKEGPRLKLYETIRERDIDAVAEMVVPVPALGSKHLRVRVL